MNAISSAEEHFRRGEAALQDADPTRALEYFRAANRLDPTSPRFDKALDLCRSAAKEEFFNPALYHNLARVHLAFGFKAEGIRYLRRGLMIDPENAPIMADLKVLGVRRLPPLRFLSRRHMLNRWLGAVRRHLPPIRRRAQALASKV